MIRSIVIITVAVCFVCELQIGDSYRILGVFPAASISHQVVFRALTLELNKQGHELVVVTPNPVNDSSLTNYTEIDISFLYTAIERPNYIESRKTMNFLEFVQAFADIWMNSAVDKILGHPDMRNLYAPSNNEKFDLMMVEMLYWPGIYYLAKRFDVPVIGITSLSLTINNQFSTGIPIMPSHRGNWELEYKVSGELSFWRRLVNFIDVWNYLYWYETTFTHQQTLIAQKYFGKEVREEDLIAIEKNVSLVFVNEQEAISYIGPTVPKVINIGGFHVSKQNTTLPEDLKRVLDEAESGFIYMSLGSNARSTMMSEKTRNEFINAFSRLPYKVLWKFEDDVLPGKPDNVHVMKWVPQQAVLAHPNLKVFIYQGGLQSTEEAVANAVPLVGFPVLGDQEMQVTKMESLGVAIKLEITAVDGNELYKAITTIASDSSYKQRMINLRKIIEDKPYDPLENAVWWTEYVIRHKGAPHLQSSTVYEPWYRQQEMDIVAFISAGSVIVLSIVVVSLYQIAKILVTCSPRSHDAKTKLH